ncbi:NAD(P)-binding domain-containing protein [Micromonospora sp. NPDC049679]|uniref:flavin-containing monooxygenase n=1 Tax=Micromonospora sp. NPDC049679 TaxID=3155920 RepID=UPI0033FFBEC6
MSTSADHDSHEPVATLWRDGRPVYDRGETICVIGAGASGLAAVKNLKEHGFAVDCYERETGVGGAWNWRHDRSPVYASTHVISSKPFTQYPDFPMPDSWPDYPHHSQLLSYLERYADHFGLRPAIWFGTEAVRAEPADGDRWDVTTRSTGGYGTERTQRYAAVVVANGHNWAPKNPSYEGLEEFKGQVMHASAYKDPAQLRGKRVLVVGAGNTGCDIAVEAAQQAARCWHSTRRGYWYAPKYVLGRPADQVNDAVLAMGLPLRMRQWLFHRMLKMTVGDLTRFGLPAPDHKVYETHPIANSQLVYYVGHGAITPVRDIVRFRRNSVELVGGEEIEPDLVVFATGYLPRFDFLDPNVLGDDGSGRPTLYLNAFPRRHPTLAVAGLLQPDSGLFTLVHWQTVAIARWLRLRQTAPERAGGFQARVESDAGRRWHDAKVKDSTRHWFEVSHVDYLRALQKTLDELEVAA